jgi:hypothetical protein
MRTSPEGVDEHTSQSAGAAAATILDSHSASYAFSSNHNIDDVNFLFPARRVCLLGGGSLLIDVTAWRDNKSTLIRLIKCYSPLKKPIFYFNNNKYIKCVFFLFKNKSSTFFNVQYVVTFYILALHFNNTHRPAESE